MIYCNLVFQQLQELSQAAKALAGLRSIVKHHKDLVVKFPYYSKLQVYNKVFLVYGVTLYLSPLDDL